MSGFFVWQVSMGPMPAVEEMPLTTVNAGTSLYSLMTFMQYSQVSIRVPG